MKLHYSFEDIAEFVEDEYNEPNMSTYAACQEDALAIRDRLKQFDIKNSAGTLKASEKRECEKLVAHAHRVSEFMNRFGKREEEAGRLYMQDIKIFGEQGAGSARARFGDQFRNALLDVKEEGRATAYVDFPAVSNALYESGSAGDGVPVQVKDPVSTLTARSVVMSLPGIRKETMTSDRAIFPRVGAATADGTAEGATLTDANTQTDSVTVVAQKYSVYEELSNELVEDYSASALEVFGANMLKHLALRVDLGLLEGDGANDILGLRQVPGINTTSVAGVPSNFEDFREVEYELRAADADPRVWLMNPRTWKTLADIKTGLSNDETTLLEPDPQQGPKTLLGFPVAYSTQITTTEGATSAGSWAALLDTSQLVICERRPARLEVSRDRLFDEDKIAIRAIWRGGLAVLNPEAVSVATDVRAA